MPLGAREIFEASDGSEGYEVARQVNPDICIVDWVMEPEDGLAFIKYIRSAEDSPNHLMPIFMVSEFSEESRVMADRDVDSAPAKDEAVGGDGGGKKPS